MLLVNLCNIKFHENPLISSGVVYTGGRGERERPTDKLHVIANAQK
jgi:hypothetical protein